MIFLMGVLFFFIILGQIADFLEADKKYDEREAKKKHK